MTKSKPLSRRDFLKLAGATSAGLALSACGVNATKLPTATPVSTSTWTPTSTTTLAPSSTPPPTATPQPSALRDFAQSLGIMIGAQISSFHIMNPEYTGKDYLKLHAKEFNLLASEDIDWYSPFDHPLRPTRDQFDFTLADTAVRFAEANNQRIREHHLLWGSKSVIPPWLKNGNFSQKELFTIIEEHIATVVGRYKGRVHEWSVVNELLGLPWESGNRFWYDQLGSNLDWVEMVFGWVNEADPDASLILNDFGIEIPEDPIYYPDRARSIYSLARKLKEKGLPVKVGFQMHLDGQYYRTQEQQQRKARSLKENILKYKNVGIDVYITEFDLRMNKVPGSQEERYDIQGEAYRILFETSLEAGVESFTTWGMSDRYSYFVETLKWADADPLPFDQQYKPKPAYFALYDVLSQYVAQKSSGITATSTP